MCLPYVTTIYRHVYWWTKLTANFFPSKTEFGICYLGDFDPVEWHIRNIAAISCKYTNLLSAELPKIEGHH